MPLVDCKECNQPVSSTAVRCPKCGKKLRPGWFGKFVFLTFWLSLLLLTLLYGLGSSNSQNTIVDKTSYSYTLSHPKEALPKQEKAQYWRVIRTVGYFNMALVNEAQKADRKVYSEAVKNICGTKGFCKVIFWSDESKVPSEMPMSQASLDAETADYTFNQATGYNELLLSCSLSKDKQNCM